ncbi:MAG: T9SS C-terminal target domain-containing protein [Balneolaceae bacterium]|nr:MAG: T9SS C-terminal target domain-containing protein [Balneolaceae bacterium]
MLPRLSQLFMQIRILPYLITLLVLLAALPEYLEGQIPGRDYLPGRLIVKVEPETEFYKALLAADDVPAKSPFPANIKSFLHAYELISATPVFSPATLHELKKSKTSHDGISQKSLEIAHGLQHTFSISFGSGIDPASLAAELKNLSGVIYAEPHYVHKTAEFEIMQGYVPNDPFIGAENHNFFDYHNIYRAWAVQTGSPDVVIAIIDTGIFYDHPDLRDNLWRNPEPGRANEFFDEFEIQNDTIGWNFWEAGDIFKGEDPEQNANPVGNYSTHGTRVAGVAAAVTDNGLGMAGVGFNSRFMPIKAGGTKQYPGTIAFAYHAILYAAINGADVINCSFIGSGRSNFGRDAIAFATESGSLVVAAIGNNGTETSGTYPALFDDVLSVGAVTQQFNDKVAHFSNYSFKLDVLAVGQNVLGTTFQYDDLSHTWTPGYTASSGTSLSTPIVSGLAALIKAEHPDWPPQRIASQIRSTARSIQEANPEQRYSDRLGSGVIDAWAALTADVPVIRFTGFDFKKDELQKINIGESGTLFVEGVHFGSTSPEIRFRVESLQSGTPVMQEYTSLDALQPGENFTVGFPVSILEEFRLDAIPRFRVSYTIGGNTRDPDDFYIIEYEKLLYGVHDNNRIQVSIPSDGTIGFMNPDEQSVGLGFIPGNYENVLAEAGFMISGVINGQRVIMNQVRDSTGISRHFLPEKNMRIRPHPDIRNALWGQAAFTTEKHPEPNDLRVELETLTISRFNLDQSLFLTYRISNPGDETWKNLHFGLFNNWDSRDAGLHHTFFDDELNLLYARHQNSAPYFGVANFGGISSALAIDNDSEMTLDRASSRSDSLSFGIAYDEHDAHYDGFTDEEKHLALTAGTSHAVLQAENISTVSSTGPFTLYPQSEIRIGFVYSWGTTANQLKNQIEAALGHAFAGQYDAPGEYSRTGRVSDDLTLYPNYPNPFNSRTNIRFDIPEAGHVRLSVYNLLGMRVATLVDGVREQGPHFVEFNGSGVASGLYIVVLRADGQVQSHTMKLVK